MIYIWLDLRCCVFFYMIMEVQDDYQKIINLTV